MSTLSAEVSVFTAGGLNRLHRKDFLAKVFAEIVEELDKDRSPGKIASARQV